jgi:hypothetical protein
MSTYLDRYLQGDCEKVWGELLSLGCKIRKQPLYTDAVAVAHETMTRARSNIELLVKRLKKMGYRFAHPDRVFVPADDEFRSLLDEVEGRAGPLPLSLRMWCAVVGELNLMGSHPRLSTYVEAPQGQKLGQDFLSLFAQHGGSTSTSGDPLRDGLATSQRLLNEMMEGIKTGRARSPDLQAGLQASKQLLAGLQNPALMAGAVSGGSGTVAGPDVDSDPLVVEPLFGDEDDFEESDGKVGASALAAIIAPDAVHKTNHSGGEPYSLRFPDEAIGAHLDGDCDYGTFVEYLRVAFRWGGFPGLRASANPPREELAYLTQGLVPL